MHQCDMGDNVPVVSNWARYDLLFCCDNEVACDCVCVCEGAGANILCFTRALWGGTWNKLNNEVFC